MDIKKQSFVKGATILGATGILIKILGAAFKLPLGNLIGTTGMSYFLAPYTIYSYLLVISTAGIPTAIARLIAEKETHGDVHGAFKILDAILKPMFVVSVIIFSILFFGADAISIMVGIPESRYAFKTIAPALLFVPTMSIFRGFFQGIQRMDAFAITQIIEQLCRVIIGLALSFYLFKFSLEYAAAGASFGAAAGSMAGLIASVIIYKHFKNKYFLEKLNQTPKIATDSNRKIIKQILIVAVPITIGASIMPTMDIIDLFLVVKRLNDAGFSNSVDLYGILTGFVVTVVNFPQILIVSIQISLVPTITKLFVCYEDTKTETDRMALSKTVNTGMKISLIIGISCAVGLVSLAEPIMLLLYFRQAESAIFAAQILSVLAWNLVFLSVYQVTTAILQGLKKQVLPVINLAVGMVLKIVLTYILVGEASVGINGAAFSSIAAFAVAASLNVFAIYRIQFLEISIFKLAIKPLVSATVMGIFVKLAYSPLSVIMGAKIATLATIIMAVIIYVFMIFASKTLSEEELKMLPIGIFKKRSK